MVAMEAAAMEVAATAVAIEVAATAVAIMVAMEVAIMVAMEVVAMEVAIMVAMEVVAMEVAAMAMAIIALTLIILLEQKVGKTEAMEILLITLNMKMVGAGEKGECPMRAMLQTRQINNPFL
jgi:hypothetical protein